MRIGKSLAVFGILLIGLSFATMGRGGEGAAVVPGSYIGPWIRTGGDFFLSVETNNHGDVISIFILNYEDTLKVINSTSTMNTSPIHAMINVTGYEGRIQILVPGLYSILVTMVTCFANETVAPEMGVSIHVEPIIPALPFTISGIGLLTTGLIVILVKKFK